MEIRKAGNAAGKQQERETNRLPLMTGIRGRVFMSALIVLLLVFLPGQVQAKTLIQGIDVSKWQGTIDWQAVKEDGIEFVMLGTGRYKNGVATPDPTFETNIQGAIAAGVYVGVYHYATATTVDDARNAADYVLDLVDGYTISYPIAIDMEDSVYSTLTKTKRTQIVKAFLEVISDAGYYPMIYASDNYFLYSLDMDSLSEYDFWVAYWVTNHPDSTPTTSPLSMWQYTSTGTVDGILTSVDMDYSYKDYSTIITPRTTAASRRVKTGWQSDGTNYWYVQEDGSIPTSTWLTIGSKKYYVDSNGYRVTGWAKISGKYYYFKKSSGVMQTGWITLSGKTYYLDPDTGARKTGWLTVDGSTYYLKKSGSPAGQRASGWLKISGKYYYFDTSTGVMQKGFLTVGGKTYYLNKSTGARKTGWVTVNGKKYYFLKKSSAAGQMATGWVKISGKYYYFSKKTGVMQKNKTIGKYTLGADGACTNR